jgi:uncharacterized membrane protein
MRNIRIAVSAFLLLEALFILLLLLSASNLPATVATHFNASGNANAWMRSSNYLAFYITFGLGLSSLIVGVFYMVRWLPPSWINLPQRDFWLTAERAPATHRYLFTRGLWLGCLMFAFLLTVHFAVVRANQLAPPHLAAKSVLVPMTIFVVTLVIWMVDFVRYFTRAQPPAGQS